MKLKLNKTNLIKSAQKYLGVYNVSLKEVLYYPKKLRATAIIVPFRIIVLLLIYTYAFNYVGRSVNGINANLAVWGISIYHILLFTQFRGIFKVINEEIRRGTLDTQLNKPYNYLIYKFWEHLGKNLPNFLISLITVVPLLYLLTGGPDTTLTLSSVFGALVLMIGGTLVSAVLYIFIVLPALWIDDAMPFFWITDKAILVFGGAYVPLALLPKALQTFANMTPFGAPMFATQMFYPGFEDKWLLLLSIQIFWIAILLFGISIVFSRAMVKLSINGG